MKLLLDEMYVPALDRVVGTLMAMAWPMKDRKPVVRVTAEPRDPAHELRAWWDAWERTEPIERDVPAAVVLAEMRDEK